MKTSKGTFILSENVNVTAHTHVLCRIKHVLCRIVHGLNVTFVRYLQKFHSIYYRRDIEDIRRTFYVTYTPGDFIGALQLLYDHRDNETSHNLS